MLLNEFLKEHRKVQEQDTSSHRHTIGLTPQSITAVALPAASLSAGAFST
jgi:hypothetical protein